MTHARSSGTEFFRRVVQLADAEPHAIGLLPQGIMFRVAAEEQAAFALAEFLQASVQGPAAKFQQRRFFGNRGFQAGQHLLGEDQTAPRLALPPLEHLQVGEADGPGQERSLGVVIGKLIQEGDGRLLDHVVDIGRSRQEHEDVAADIRLIAGPKLHEFSG